MNAPLLANAAAQLIADNGHVRRMRSHIEAIERQRRGIFEELNQEKHRSQQLEVDLRQSRAELEQLIEAKRHLEAQLAATSMGAVATSGEETSWPTSGDEKGDSSKRKGPSESNATGSNQRIASGQVDQSQAAPPSTSRQVEAPTTSARLSSGAGEQQTLPSADNSLATDEQATASLTFSSIDLYRQYIQSMTPDLDAIRRERRMILNEFDNIKRMLSDMDA